MSVYHRRQLERRIARRAIKELIEAGFWVAVNDGEETHPYSQDAAVILGQMFSVDDEMLFVANSRIFDDGLRVFDHFGWVRFVYGNDGWDVINDYSVSLEPHLTKTTALADRLEEQHGGDAYGDIRDEIDMLEEIVERLISMNGTGGDTDIDAYIFELKARIDAG